MPIREKESIAPSLFNENNAKGRYQGLFLSQGLVKEISSFIDAVSNDAKVGLTKREAAYISSELLNYNQIEEDNEFFHASLPKSQLLKLLPASLAAEDGLIADFITRNEGKLAKSSHGLNLLGDIYSNGIGVVENEKKAFDFYSAASEEEYIPARSNLGDCYKEGYGVDQDLSKARSLHQFAVDKGYGPSERAIEELESSVIVPESVGASDESDSKDLNSTKTDEKNENINDSKTTFGKDYFEKAAILKSENPKEAVSMYQMAMEKGSLEAVNELGLCFVNGIGVEKDLSNGVEHFKITAKQGNAVGQIMLGNCYQEGKSVAKSYEEAARQYTLAADQGNAEGQVMLGICYQQGEGVAVSHNKAVRLYSLAADQGNAEAQFRLGEYYQMGVGVDKSCEKAAKLYNSSAEQGFDLAKTTLKNHYAFNKDTDNDMTFALYKLYASKGTAEAQCGLGFCYERGIGTVKDPEVAFKNYQLAADEGYPGAQIRLIYSYQRGLGVDESYDKAAELHQLYADKGNTEVKDLLQGFYSISRSNNYKMTFALYKLDASKDLAEGYNGLGKCYENGIGVDRSYDEAAKLYQLSADKGNTQAKELLQNHYLFAKFTNNDIIFALYKLDALKGTAEGYYGLGRCYKDGIGTDQNQEEAFKNYKLSSEQRSPEAQYELGFCYEHGIGTTQNQEEAFKNYKLSSEKGNREAQFRLGKCYENGEGVDKSDKEAFKLYKLSADQGYSEAQLVVGNCFRNEIGVKKDPLQEVKYYKLSSDNGNMEAKYHLGNCYKTERGEKNEYLRDKGSYDLFKEVADSRISSKFQHEAQYEMGLYFRKKALKSIKSREIYHEKSQSYFVQSSHENNENRDKPLYERGKFYQYEKTHLGNNEIEKSLYKESSDLGNTDATFKLAECYSKELLYIKDDGERDEKEKKMLDLYVKAADNNNEKSINFLVDYYSQQSDESKDIIKLYDYKKLQFSDSEYKIDNLYRDRNLLGSTINKEDKNGLAPLDRAAQTVNAKEAKILIKCGASIFKRLPFDELKSSNSSSSSEIINLDRTNIESFATNPLTLFVKNRNSQTVQEIITSEVKAIRNDRGYKEEFKNLLEFIDNNVDKGVGGLLNDKVIKLLRNTFSDSPDFLEKLVKDNKNKSVFGAVKLFRGSTQYNNAEPSAPPYEFIQEAKAVSSSSTEPSEFLQEAKAISSSLTEPSAPPLQSNQTSSVLPVENQDERENKTLIEAEAEVISDDEVNSDEVPIVEAQLVTGDFPAVPTNIPSAPPEAMSIDLSEAPSVSPSQVSRNSKELCSSAGR